MSVGDARAIGYEAGRNATNVKLQVQRAAKLIGKNVNVGYRRKKPASHVLSLGSAASTPTLRCVSFAVSIFRKFVKQSFDDQSRIFA